MVLLPLATRQSSRHLLFLIPFVTSYLSWLPICSSACPGLSAWPRSLLPIQLQQACWFLSSASCGLWSQVHLLTQHSFRPWGLAQLSLASSLLSNPPPAVTSQPPALSRPQLLTHCCPCAACSPGHIPCCNAQSPHQLKGWPWIPSSHPLVLKAQSSLHSP